MKYIIPDLNSFNRNSVKLDWNEGSSEIINSFNFLDTNRLKNYPLLESNELKNDLNLKHNIDNNQLELVITSGSDEFNFRLLLGLKEQISNIIYINPSYDQIRNDSNLFGIDVVEIKADPFEYLSFELFKEIDFETNSLFYFTNPNNPTGMLLKKEFIVSLLKKFKNSIFLIDEAYVDFCEKNSLFDLINEYKNLIFTRTFSKAFSLASLRVGYGVYNKNKFPSLIKYFNPKSVSLISTVVCRKVLNENKHLKYIEDVKKFKEYLRGLNEKNLIINEGNFFLYKPKSNIKEYIAKLKKNKIYVRDRSHLYGLEGYVRISISDYSVMISLVDILLEKK